jgi:ubiquitin-like 1-activating enzyme E1 A
VLIYGLGGIGAEVAKNLLLAGISGTVADAKLTSSDDLSSNFFLDVDDIGVNRAQASLPRLQELNAHVSVACITEPIENMSESTIKEHSLVILTGVPLEQQVRVDTICRANGIAFFAVEAMGYEALLFVDMGPSHKYRTEAGAGADMKLSDEIEMNCPSLQEASSTPWASLLKPRFGFLSRALVHARIISEFRSLHGRYPSCCSNIKEGTSDADVEEVFAIGQRLLQAEKVELEGKPYSLEEAQMLTATSQMEIAPVCAIMGGVLGQEVVKYVSCKGEPISNYFCLDAVSGHGKVFRAPVQ